VGGGGGFLRGVFRGGSKIAFGNIAWLSFKWLLEAYSV